MSLFPEILEATASKARPASVNYPRSIVTEATLLSKLIRILRSLAVETVTHLLRCCSHVGRVCLLCPCLRLVKFSVRGGSDAPSRILVQTPATVTPRSTVAERPLRLFTRRERRSLLTHG